MKIMKGIKEALMEWYMGQLGTSLMEKNVELEVEW
jgi:hypothetical protein